MASIVTSCLESFSLLQERKEKARRAYLHRVARRKTCKMRHLEDVVYYYLIKDMPTWLAIEHVLKIKKTIKVMELSNLIDCSIELNCGRERKENILKEILAGGVVGDANYNPLIIYTLSLMTKRIKEEGKLLLEKELKSLEFSSLEEISKLSSKRGCFGPSEALARAINGACYNRGEYSRFVELLDLRQAVLREKALRLSPKRGDLM